MTNPASELTLPDPSTGMATVGETDADASLSMLDGKIQGWEAFVGSESGIRPKNAVGVFGNAADGGQVYRWGVAVASGGACDDVTQMITRLACDAKLRKKHRAVDLIAAVDSAIDRFNDPSTPSVQVAASAVRWAAAVDRVLPLLDVAHAHRLVRSLLDLHEAVVSRAAYDCPLHLIVAGELGLTLAWRLPDLAAAAKLRDVSVEAVAQWCGGEHDSVAAAIEGGTDARLVLASLLRCKVLVAKKSLVQKAKKNSVDQSTQSSSAGPALKHSIKTIGDGLATWVAALTACGGVSAFSSATSKDVQDDKGTGGLLEHAKAFDRDALGPAIDAALGSHPTGGRLAWEVSLPEAIWCDDDAKMAVLMPEWDVRKGRTVVDYRGEQVNLEIYAGKSKAISGTVHTTIRTDETEQQPRGPWEEICRYTDDEVHYLEIEQAWTGGLVLQRQFLLIRDDRCVMFADTVLPDPAVLPESTESSEVPHIEYSAALPVGVGMMAKQDKDIRELLLCDTRSKGAARALVFPLSGNEWNVGPTLAKLGVETASGSGQNPEGSLVLQSSGRGRLYTPMWMDFERRRFKRDRTWRVLTVGDALRLCRPEEASAYRIQSGSDQWCVYRSLGQPRCRTFLGKHMMANFFVSRFDMGDGVHESLITVDEEQD